MRANSDNKSENNLNNIVRFRKPININIGMILFLAIIVYLIFAIYTALGSTSVVRYEVKEGSLAIDTIYDGIILRDEIVVRTENAGFINFYAYEGERVAVGDLVYTVDETGKLKELIESMESDFSELSDKSLKDFRNDIQNFRFGFQSSSFKSVYDFKHNLNNSILKLANQNLLSNIAESSKSGNGIRYCYSPYSGIVSFWIDGYESLKADEITKDILKGDTYEKNIIAANSLVGTQDPAYKVCNDEHWSVVISVDEEMAEELEEEKVVKVRFLKNQYESWANVEILRRSEDEVYAKLDFTNSMLTFISDRFLKIELILHDQTGLKIPLSSIVEKEFYLVDEAFLIKDAGGKQGVMRQCYLEDGTISTEFVPINVYSFDEETKEYYLDSAQLNAGDVLHQLESQNTFTVSKRATLIGVYNMNKGYADFKEIKKLYENEEYAIVKANTTYGLNVYDYIVLDAKSVKDDQFIKQ